MFFPFKYSAMNACAFLIDASSVMSSCTGTTVDEAWTSAENLASASSAFANFREPVYPSYQSSRPDVVHIAALTHKNEHIRRHRELVHSVHSQTYGLLENGGEGEYLVYYLGWSQ
jgi:hypothetical protein